MPVRTNATGQNEKGKGPLETRCPLRATLIMGAAALKYTDDQLIRPCYFIFSDSAKEKQTLKYVITAKAHIKRNYSNYSGVEDEPRYI